MKEKALRKLLIKNMPEVHWQPIESGGVARGIPDLNGCWNGKEIWIELKQGWPRLSAFQKNWIRTRRESGGTVWVLTTTDSRWLVGWRGEGFEGLLVHDSIIQTPLCDADWRGIRQVLFA